MKMTPKTVRIKLQSCSRIFKVDFQAMKMSRTFRKCFGSSEHETPEKRTFLLSEMKEQVFEKVVEWINHEKNNLPPELPKDNQEFELSQWDRNFFDTCECRTFADLLVAAKFLEIPKLSQVLKKYVQIRFNGVFDNASTSEDRMTLESESERNLPQQEEEGCYGYCPYGMCSSHSLY